MGGFLGEQDTLWQALEGVLRDEGVCIYDLEVHGGHALRVTIDRPKGNCASAEAAAAEHDAPEGRPERITSGDCSRVCRRLMVYFQVEGPALGLSAEPQIEVSSPGVNRALRLKRHFAGAAGERVKIVYAPPEGEDGGSRTVVGTLESFSDDTAVVADEQSGGQVAIPFSKVKRAGVEFKF